MCFCQIHCDGVGIATKFPNSYSLLPARSINSRVVQMEVPDFISKLNELQDTEPERAANLMTTFANMMEPVAPPLKKTKRRFAKFQAGALAMTTSEESSEYKQTNRNAGGRIKRQKTRGVVEAGRTLNRYRTLAACCFRNDDFSLADVLAATTEYSAPEQTRTQAVANEQVPVDERDQERLRNPHIIWYCHQLLHGMFFKLPWLQPILHKPHSVVD
jgi:hypothetical protein